MIFIEKNLNGHQSKNFAQMAWSKVPNKSYAVPCLTSGISLCQKQEVISVTVPKSKGLALDLRYAKCHVSSTPSSTFSFTSQKKDHVMPDKRSTKHDTFLHSSKHYQMHWLWSLLLLALPFEESWPLSIRSSIGTSKASYQRAKKEKRMVMAVRANMDQTSGPKNFDTASKVPLSQQRGWKQSVQSYQKQGGTFSNKLYSKLSNNWPFWPIMYLFFILGLPLAALFKSAGAALFDDFWEVSTSPVALSAYSYTLSMALFAALFNGVFGLLLAWVLVRYRFWGRSLLDKAVDLPFALPTSVAGLTLASLYSEKTILGQFFHNQGYNILFTPIAVGIAMIFVSFPFVVRTVKPVLQDIEKELEEAAWSLGASSFTTFRKVLFPPIKPALITGMTLAFSRAVGEYGSIVVVSSNMPEKDLITSVLIFQNLEQYSHRAAAIIGTVSLILSLFLLFIVNTLGLINPRK